MKLELIMFLKQHHFQNGLESTASQSSEILNPGFKMMK